MRNKDLQNITYKTKDLVTLLRLLKISHTFMSTYRFFSHIK